MPRSWGGRGRGRRGVWGGGGGGGGGIFWELSKKKSFLGFFPLKRKTPWIDFFFWNISKKKLSKKIFFLLKRKFPLNTAFFFLKKFFHFSRKKKPYLKEIYVLGKKNFFESFFWNISKKKSIQGVLRLRGKNPKSFSSLLLFFSSRKNK